MVQLIWIPSRLRNDIPIQMYVAILDVVEIALPSRRQRNFDIL